MKRNNHNIAIEHFLKRVLNVKPNTKVDSRLTGFYQSIELYEQGYGIVSIGKHEKSYQSYLKYFERAIDRLSKKHSVLKAHSVFLKQRMEIMSDSEDILWLYDEIQRCIKS